jgi:hypothetical protein
VNAAQFAGACVLAAGAVVVTVLAAIGQAALARLWFRHRIEVIRDEAVTAVLDGIVPLADPVTGWLAALEATATHARPRDIELACTVLSGDSQTWTYPGLTPAGRHLLTALTDRTRAAAIACLTWSRPAALLQPAPSCPAAEARLPRHDSNGGEAESDESLMPLPLFAMFPPREDLSRPSFVRLGVQSLTAVHVAWSRRFGKADHQPVPPRKTDDEERPSRD